MRGELIFMLFPATKNSKQPPAAQSESARRIAFRGKFTFQKRLQHNTARCSVLFARAYARVARCTKPAFGCTTNAPTMHFAHFFSNCLLCARTHGRHRKINRRSCCGLHDDLQSDAKTPSDTCHCKALWYGSRRVDQGPRR